MILDHLSRADLYAGLNPGFAAAFAFLRRADLAGFADGRHAVDGDRVYVLLQRYATKPFAGGRLEIHRRYIDIQCLIEGVEAAGYEPLADQPVAEAYDPARDVAFLEGTGDPVVLRPGLFAVFFPHDAHLPGRTHGASAPVRKAVVKVAV